MVAFHLWIPTTWIKTSSTKTESGTQTVVQSQMAFMAHIFTFLLILILPPAPILPEEPVTVQQGTPVTRVIPPGFTYTNDAKSLGLCQSVELLLLVPHFACISVETFQAWYIEADTL